MQVMRLSHSSRPITLGPLRLNLKPFEATLWSLRDHIGEQRSRE